MKLVSKEVRILKMKLVSKEVRILKMKLVSKEVRILKMKLVSKEVRILKMKLVSKEGVYILSLFDQCLGGFKLYSDIQISIISNLHRKVAKTHRKKKRKVKWSKSLISIL